MPLTPAPLPIAVEPNARAPFLLVFPSIVLPMFLASLDQTIVATALPTIAGQLGDVGRVSWVVIFYLIATTIAAPVFGRLGDVLGRRRMLFAALGLFTAASVLCAAAPSVLLLAGARVLQGLGGGGMMTTSQALIGEAVPPRERGRYQGYLSLVFAASATLGPVAGGYLTQHFGWQSVFLVNIPLGCLAAAMAVRLPDRAPAGDALQFDWLGTLLLATVIVPLLLALHRVQSMNATALPDIVALLVLSAAALALLLWQERRAPAPLLPLSLLRQTTMWRCNLMGVCVAATLVPMVTFVPIWLQVVRGVDPVQVGLMLLPMTVGIAAGSLVAGRVITRTGYTAIIASIGLAVTVPVLAILAVAGPALSTGVVAGLFLLYSLSIGTVMPVVQVTVQAMAKRNALGTASASVALSRSVGAALGTALVGAVLFASLAAVDRSAAALFAEIVERGPNVLAALDPVRQALVASEIGAAFRAAFLTIALVCGVGTLMAWTIPLRRI